MKRYAVALIALLGAGLSVWASPAYRAELTVSGYTGKEELADFPVLVRISPQTIRGFDYGQCLDGAADLSFVDANENLLDWQDGRLRRAPDRRRLRAESPRQGERGRDRLPGGG